jgi:hypothetical protein
MTQIHIIIRNHNNHEGNEPDIWAFGDYKDAQLKFKELIIDEKSDGLESQIDKANDDHDLMYTEEQYYCKDHESGDFVQIMLVEKTL